MSSEERPEDNRSELIEKLRALETPQSASTLAELSYRRAREALERAIEEAREIRLAALEDARTTRERELSVLLESLRALREAAETEVKSILTKAQLEAGQVRDRALHEAEATIAAAREEAEAIRSEAAAIRAGADGRAREAARLEADFNAMVGKFAERACLAATPEGGWLRHLFGRSAK